jgi:hypothetical protein
MPKTFLAPKHASAQTHLSISRLAQLEALGQLEALRDTLGRRFYDPDEIDRFIREREVQRREREQARVNASEPRSAA